MADEPNELKRAKLVMKELDVLITFASTLMNMLTQLAKGKMNSEKDKGGVNGYKLRIYDAN